MACDDFRPDHNGECLNCDEWAGEHNLGGAMRIEAHPTKAGDLRPGDLFSAQGPMYWDFRDRLAVGEKVFIRTEGPCPAEQVEDLVFRIVIHHADGRAPF